MIIQAFGGKLHPFQKLFPSTHHAVLKVHGTASGSLIVEVAVLPAAVKPIAGAWPTPSEYPHGWRRALQSVLNFQLYMQVPEWDLVKFDSYILVGVWPTKNKIQRLDHRLSVP